MGKACPCGSGEAHGRCCGSPARYLELRFRDQPEVLAVAHAYEVASAAWDEQALEDYHHAVEELFGRGGLLHDFVLEQAARHVCDLDDEPDLVERVAAALDRAARFPRSPRERTGAVIALQSLEEGTWGEASLLWELDQLAGELADRAARERRLGARPAH
jgi:hypothetical protein